MKLIAQAGPSVGMDFPLTKAVITIGRGSDNDIVLSDEQVSRRHAEIRRQDDNFIITDLNSTNGTFVNELRIQKAQSLQHGDRIDIGTSSFLFQMIPERELVPALAAQPVSHPPKRRRGLLPVLLAAIGAVLFVSVFIAFFALWGPKGEIPTPTETATVAQLATATPTNTSLPPTPTLTVSPTRTLVHTPTSTSTPTLTDISTPTSTPTLTPTTTPDAIVDTTALNVRAGPGIAFDIVGGVYESDELEVIAKTPPCDWLQVITPDGTEGWVSAHYVKLNINCDDIPAGSIPPTPTPQ